MTEAILSHGASGLSSVFAKYSMTVQQIRNSWYDAENDDNFPKTSAGSLAEKNWMRQYDYIYTEITQTIFFCIFTIIAEHT